MVRIARSIPQVSQCIHGPTGGRNTTRSKLTMRCVTRGLPIFAIGLFLQRVSRFYSNRQWKRLNNELKWRLSAVARPACFYRIFLHRNGIDSIVLERQSRSYVLERIRAGVLEAGTVELLREVGLGMRMDREGHPHDGSAIAWEGRPRFFIDTKKFTGKRMMAYGQTAITEDLYAARDAAGGQIIDEAGNVQLHELTTSQPYVTYDKSESSCRIDCDYVAGCDGYHGVSRPAIPSSVLRTYEKSYPFGWIGIMSETPPFPDICYCYHHRGFALASMRNPILSRYYIQCDLETKLEDWPDDRFWKEFQARCPEDMANRINTGPSIEKSIAPLRSFVAEPMRYGRLFLAGDAAHIVPRPGRRA